MSAGGPPRPPEPTSGQTKPYIDAPVVVLGASGFIGRWVALHLARIGARVHAPVRDVARTSELFSSYAIDAVVERIDLSAFSTVGEFLRRARPAVVFNLAGYGVDRTERDEKTAFRINARLVRTLVLELADADGPAWPGQRLVHVGSALEYGTAKGDLAEDTRASPTTLYGRSKLAGTLLLQRAAERTGVRALTARLFTVYGPGEHVNRLLPSLIGCAEDGRPLDLTRGDQERDFTYVEDVAEGLLRLALSGAEPGAVVNLATGIITPVREFVQIAAEVLEIPSEHLRFGALATRSEEMSHRPVAITRLRRLTGWAPSTGIREGISRTAAFHRRRVER